MDATDGTLEGTTVWTIGHSTRPIEAFLAALRAHGLDTVADVRAFPASRRHPQFARDALERALGEAGFRYVWMGEGLGGRRRSGGGPSRNAAIRDAGLRAYADHMATAPFRAAVRALRRIARASPTAVMCAELLWWRCHRSLLADHLALVEGARVLHVRDERVVEAHRPKREARVEDDRVVYDVGELPFAGA
jgi:uncharacterized protein (DUF488 family)